MISGFRNSKKFHMKTNENTNHQPDENRSRNSESGGQRSEIGTETPDQWWGGLTAAEKQFAYDLNDVARGLVESRRVRET